MEYRDRNYHRNGSINRAYPPSNDRGYNGDFYRPRYPSNSSDYGSNSNRYIPEPIDNRPNDHSRNYPPNNQSFNRGQPEPNPKEVEKWKALSEKIKEWNEERKEIYHITFPDKVSIVIL